MQRYNDSHSYVCHKGMCGIGGAAPHILKLGTRWEVSGQLHAPTTLPLVKQPPVPTHPKVSLDILEKWKISFAASCESHHIS